MGGVCSVHTRFNVEFMNLRDLLRFNTLVILETFGYLLQRQSIIKFNESWIMVSDHGFGIFLFPFWFWYILMNNSDTSHRVTKSYKILDRLSRLHLRRLFKVEFFLDWKECKSGSGELFKWRNWVINPIIISNAVNLLVLRSALDYFWSHQEIVAMANSTS